MGSRRIRFGMAIVLAYGALACGQGEEKSGRVASMVAQSVEPLDERAVVGPPAVASIELEPRRPVAGARLRAKALLRDARGQKVGVDYQWQTASGRPLAEGRDLDTTGLEPGSVVEVVATPRYDEQSGEPFTHRFRLEAEASQIAVVVIDSRDGKSVGSLLRAVVATTDDEAGFDEVALEWRVAGKLVGNDEDLDTTPFRPGDVVELRARPAEELAEESGRSRPVHAEPIVLEPSPAPAITSKPSSGVEDGRYRYVMQAESPVRGAQLRYELLKGPEGMTVDAESGLVEWHPKTGQRGPFDVEVAVMDQWGSGMAQGFAISTDSTVAPPAAAQ
jgi:hypothetical protein